MSKNKNELTSEDILGDDQDLVVERHPRSNISFFATTILLAIFIVFSFAVYEEAVTPDNETIVAEENVSSQKEKTRVSTTHFHQLVAKGTVSEIEEQIYLIDKQLINQVVNGMTPIMLAASRGSVEIIDLLFTQGADPNKRGAGKRTALQYAAEKNRIEAAQRLLAYGADIDAYDNTRLTPLVMAASRGYTELGLLFIENGADVDIQHAEGWTALIDAAAHNDETLVKALLKAGANKNLKANNGKSAIDYAREYGFTNMVKILTD